MSQSERDALVVRGYLPEEERENGAAIKKGIEAVLSDIELRCITVDVSQSERDALVVRGYLPEEERENGAAIKKGIEAVLSDIELDLQYETAERSRTRG